jgi:hypothetical protein
MLRLSLPLEHINKNNTFRKNFTEKEGGGTLNCGAIEDCRHHVGVDSNALKNDSLVI